MIYLDYNATTPVLPPILDRMLPYFGEQFGNPSSGSHSYGWSAEAAVEVSAEQAAALIGADPSEVVFTGGATEAINHAIKGLTAEGRGRHVVTVATEHKAVLDTCAAVANRGVDVTTVGVDRQGNVDIDELVSAIRDDTAVVAVMWANNETGAVHPIAEIGAAVRARGVPLLCDATQAVGKIPVSFEYVDLLACSAHKFYGPKGVGLLVAHRGRRSVRLPRFIDGGGQQDERRGGTLNVPAIVGLGAAAELARQDLEKEGDRQRPMRDALESKLLAAWPDAYVNGNTERRLPQTTNVTFPGIDAAKLMAELRSLAVSNASACQSASGKPSHVLLAMGLSDADARAAIRFSLGRPTTYEDIVGAAEMVAAALDKIAAPAA